MCAICSPTKGLALRQQGAATVVQSRAARPAACRGGDTAQPPCSLLPVKEEAELRLLLQLLLEG